MAPPRGQYFTLLPPFVRCESSLFDRGLLHNQDSLHEPHCYTTPMDKAPRFIACGHHQWRGFGRVIPPPCSLSVEPVQLVTPRP